MDARITRRAALAAPCAACAVAVLGGCSTYGGEQAAEAPAQAPPAAQPGGQPGGRLAAVGDIPVNGGRIFADRKVVVTQPEEGTFRAFAAVCTHQGCAVTEVKGTINCPCHGSKFNLDGTVAAGPAARPLPPVAITVDGGSISLS